MRVLVDQFCFARFGKARRGVALRTWLDRGQRVNKENQSFGKEEEEEEEIRHLNRLIPILSVGPEA